MIDFQATGWPPSAEDVKRLEDYQRYTQLFEGDHASAFAEKSAKLPSGVASKVYLIADYPKLISNVCGDMLFGEAPIFSAEDEAEQKLITDLVDSNDLISTLMEAALSQSFRGDAVFRCRVGTRDTDGQRGVIIEEVPAHSYFQEVDSQDCRRVLSEAIAWVHPTEESDYLRVEHHLKGEVVQQAFELDLNTGKVGDFVPLEFLHGSDAPPEREATGLPFSLLTHIPNTRHGSRRWGASDFAGGLESLFDAVNNRLSKIEAILDKHADPNLVVPQGTLDDDGNLEKSTGLVFEVPTEDGGSNLPRYMTWEGQLLACFQELEVLGDLIFKFSEISPAIFGQDKAGSIESGRAMRMRFIRTLAKMSRKKQIWDPRLKRILWVARKLGEKFLNWPAAPESPAKTVEIEWQDGLPVDQTEQVGIEVQRVREGLTTKEKAIRRLDQVNAAQARKELAAIAKEKAAATPPQLAAAPPTGTEPPPAENSPDPAARPPEGA